MATTILSSPAASEDPRVRAAALATLGSIKIDSGAFQQGAQILGQALAIESSQPWEGRLDAEADRAIAMLILGDLDQALTELHSVQQRFLLAGRWQSLVQSLENEARLLEVEGRHAQVAQLRERISQLEQL